MTQDSADAVLEQILLVLHQLQRQADAIGQDFLAFMLEQAAIEAQSQLDKMGLNS